MTISSEGFHTGSRGNPRPFGVAVTAFGRTKWLLIVVLAAQTFGCAAPRRSVTAYEGERLAPSHDERALPRFEAIPPQARVLGRVSAACNCTFAPGPAFSTRLSALVCSPAWLSLAVDERARSIGGTALHGFSCDVSESEDDRVERVECAAEVLSGDVPVELEQTLGPRRAFRPSVVLDAAVEYRGAVRSKRNVSGGKSVVSDAATEVPSMPASDRPLGSLRIRVDDPGTVEEARAGLLLAAAALGGAHVVAPTCLREPAERGSSCTATVTAPEVEGAR